jgi:hypothetical protein
MMSEAGLKQERKNTAFSAIQEWQTSRDGQI